MNLKVYKLLIVLVILLSITNCAKRGRPTGGPVDENPPILVSASPKQESVNFKETKIKIYFDEYIKIKDLKKNLVISPPQKNEPQISPVGTPSKVITIKILDTLDANTTYLFNFGNGVVDNNEENVLQNFKYVFSTGSFIDSLTLSGEVTDPLIKKPEAAIDVMLYEYDSTYYDSIIFKQKPKYITNTLDTTLYNLTNLRAGKYLLIALSDQNNNKIFDPKVDKIGFINDTVTLPTDEIYNIKIFKEVPELRVFKPKEVTKGHLIFPYEGDASNLNIKILSPVTEDFKFEMNYEKDRDTINYWYTPMEVDSLNFEVSKNNYSENLTLKIRNTELDTLKVNSSVKGFISHLDTLFITTNNPIIKLDTSKISIVKDSIPIKFTTKISKSKTKFSINFNKDFDAQYNFNILPNTIEGIFGFKNDSITFNLKTKKLEDYGSIAINIVSSQKTSFIVDLLNEKGLVIRKQVIKHPQIVNFAYLNPGNYLVRVTLDKNNNGIWDTGNYLEKLQPEEILFYDKILELRVNWDLNETFNID